MFNQTLNTFQQQYNTPIISFNEFPIQSGSAFIKTKVTKEFITNPISLTIKSFYPTILSHLPKEYFSHTFIPQLIKDSIENKQNQIFINSIYGYINNSILVSNKNIRGIVTEIANEFLQPLYDTNNLIYIDTDLMIFTSSPTQEQIDYITNAQYSFIITKHTLGAIFNKKQILLS